MRKFKHRKKIDNVIISLTSFPARINSLWIIIETLLRQTYRPEKVILWLADSQFVSINDLPKKLLQLRSRGLEIKFCDDLRSHKKYYYSMKYYPNHTIVTVDDDTFYPENLVEKLFEASRKFPNTICCNLGHILKVHNGMVEPYANWKSGADGYDQPSDFLVPIGCEGVLYPPRSLNENVFDKDQIQELCPLADDLWLKSMGTINGTKAVKTNPTSITYANLISAKATSLCTINFNKNMNDKQIQNIISRYPELKKIWK